MGLALIVGRQGGRGGAAHDLDLLPALRIEALHRRLGGGAGCGTSPAEGRRAPLSSHEVLSHRNYRSPVVLAIRLNFD